MSIFTIDESKCKRDGICVRECPAKIIIMKDDNSVPELAHGGDAYCINCGHCLAVCPHAALTLGETRPESCESFKPEMLPSEDQFAHFLRTRRSPRAFSDRPVDRSVIEKCIDVAKYAPSGHNLEPVHWTVIHDSKEVLRLSGFVAEWMKMMIAGSPQMAESLHLDMFAEAWERGENLIVRGAPHVVIAHADRTKLPSQMACAIALSHFELALYSHGVGATWGGFFHAASATFPAMVQALALPNGHMSYGAMLVGYNKHKYKRIPPRQPARVEWK